MSTTSETIKAKTEAAKALGVKVKELYDKKNNGKNEKYIASINQEIENDLASIKKADDFLKQNRNFQALKNKALSVQYGKLIPKLTYEQTVRDVTNYFLAVGLNLKGNNQCCYQSYGIQSEVDASFDFGRLMSGVFSVKVSAGVTSLVSLQQMLILQVGPSSIESYTVPKPVIINLCEGVLFRGELRAGVFAGVAVEAGFELGLAVPGNDLSVDVNAGVTAGATGNGSIKGSYFYAEDNICNSFEKINNINLIKKKLDEIFGDKGLITLVEESTENLLMHRLKPTIITSILISSTAADTDWKFDAEAHVGVKCALVDASINATANALVEVSGKNINVRYQTVYKAAQTNQVLINAQQDEIVRIKAAINEYDKGKKRWFRSPSLESLRALELLNGINKDSELVRTVKGLLGLSAKIGVDPLKPTSTFYGLLYNALKDASVVMTQDSRIIYQQYGYDSKAEIALKHGKKEIPVLGTQTKFYYNRLSYQTVTVFWYSENKRHPYFNKSSGWFSGPNKGPKQIEATALKGSGISYGGSFALADLKKALEFDIADLLMITPDIPEESHNDFELKDLGPFREITSDIPEESHNDFALKDLGPFREITSDIKDEKNGIYQQEIVNSRPMNRAIKHVLDVFDVYIKASWTARKPDAAKRLEDMIEKNEPVGPAVAWLINENNENSAEDSKYNAIFRGKHSGYKEGHTATKALFFKALTSGYKIGLHDEKSESDLNEKESINLKNLQKEQDEWNENIRTSKVRNTENLFYNRTLRNNWGQSKLIFNFTLTQGAPQLSHSYLTVISQLSHSYLS